MKLIDLSDEKLRNAIIFFVKNAKFVGITKLMKLLYYLDFYHYKETGFPVTSQCYRTWQYGPVPIAVWEELKERHDRGLKLSTVVRAIPGEDEGALKILPMKGAKFNEDVFSPRELRIMLRVAEIFKDATAKQMVECTHMRKQPWESTLKKHGENVSIDYELAFDGTETESQMDTIRKRQEEFHETCSMIEGI